MGDERRDDVTDAAESNKGAAEDAGAGRDGTARDGAGDDAARDVATKARGRGADPVTVAVVDDDASVLTLVASVLSGYDVVVFDRPQRALEALRNGLHPELIVSDVIMPGMTGFELHEAVRGVTPLRSVPFIYLTSMTDREHIRRGMAQGADDYLTKPFTPGELREAVHTRLERAGALRDAEEDELVITSLGGLGVAFGAMRLRWEARKAVELLMFLLASGFSCTVHEARAEMWWGPSADNHLHVLISRLRKMLADVAVVTLDGDRLELKFPGKVRWDAETFEHAAEAALQGNDAAAVERAAHLYGGDFLPGFDSPWAERKQANLEELYVRLLEAAVERADGDAERQRAQDRLDAFIDVED
jgi:two-component SAPR family response regulator